MYDLKVENLIEDALATMYQDKELDIDGVDHTITIMGFNCKPIIGSRCQVSVFCESIGPAVVEISLDVTKELRKEFMDQFMKKVTE